MRKPRWGERGEGHPKFLLLDLSVRWGLFIAGPRAAVNTLGFLLMETSGVIWRWWCSRLQLSCKLRLGDIERPVQPSSFSRRNVTCCLRLGSRFTSITQDCLRVQSHCSIQVFWAPYRGECECSRDVRTMFMCNGTVTKTFQKDWGFLFIHLCSAPTSFCLIGVAPIKNTEEFWVEHTSFFLFDWPFLSTWSKLALEAEKYDPKDQNEDYVAVRNDCINIDFKSGSCKAVTQIDADQ